MNKSKDQILLENAYQQIYNIPDDVAAKKIAEKIKGTPNLDIAKLKMYVAKYLNMVGKNETDIEHLTALVHDNLSEMGLIESSINEAKKKINPWAVEKALEKKTGKTFSKDKKEKVIKGIKKSAKKYGKKITSDKVVKEEYEDEGEELNVGSTNFPHGYGYPNKSEEDSEYNEVVYINYFADDFNEEKKTDDPQNYPAFVTAYDLTRAFGGYEEGGWWYDAYHVLDSKKVQNFEEAEKAAKDLYDSYINEADGKLIINLESQQGSQVQERPRYE